jgi:hypothetical protein
MKIYRTIATLKAKEVVGNRPTHFLVAKENQGDQKGEFVASLWAKESNGSKFLSGEMKAQYTDHTDSSKSRKGFVIVEEAELNKLVNELKTLKSSDVNVRTPEGVEYPEEEDINEEDIPF